MDVYSELLSFKERTISTTQRNVDEMSKPEAQKDAEETDLTILDAERDRIRNRLEFWQRRHRELSSHQ